jgi:hypothetical protein
MVKSQRVYAYSGCYRWGCRVDRIGWVNRYPCIVAEGICHRHRELNLLTGKTVISFTHRRVLKAKFIGSAYRYRNY